MAEPEGSENWPVFDDMDRPSKGEPGHVPCWWTNHGKTDKEVGNTPTFGSTKSFREGYDDIRWED